MRMTMLGFNKVRHLQDHLQLQSIEIRTHELRSVEKMVTVVSRPRLDRESDQRESRRAIDGMKMERGKREEEEEEEEEEVKRKRKTAGEGG